MLKMGDGKLYCLGVYVWWEKNNKERQEHDLSKRQIKP